eukprot:CAMPEP_0197685960 /NCGR_PEP_ID=MMETSP1338-20131121/101776_1 /TAXON_ID=43686 ORGANISM="Pelagodinium beii, Strain RCC1491" /NCGR_SAMPLE_ID=MMETSP1338 /ASSEMBLY_ACC=CAM_ASM_000754 /LENGTH=50 /DNA_ID=CAMNT_0043267847 /DNA_START=47 /DNA_END=199 /DNA_ORIENTATION=+
MASSDLLTFSALPPFRSSLTGTHVSATFCKSLAMVSSSGDFAKAAALLLA